MGKYLKEFDTHQQYIAYTADTSNFITPNVSYCIDTPNEVHYNPYVDPYAGHEYVEIGGLKWATMNVGATSITDTGLYFQWGDTQGYTADQCGSGEGQKYFGWADYKYCSGAGTSSSAITKYNDTDGKTVLEASDDAAQVNWGGSWRMPTTDEFVALGTAVSTAYTNDYQGSGVAGLICTDKTDNSKVLFFPDTAYCYKGSVYYWTRGYYWSSSFYVISPQKAYQVDTYNKKVGWKSNGERVGGATVRPVVG